MKYAKKKYIICLKKYKTDSMKTNEDKSQPKELQFLSSVMSLASKALNTSHNHSTDLS